MDSTGEKIYQLRKSKGFTQEEFADKVGVSRQTVYKWEAGYVAPSKDNLKLICEVLAVGLEYFFNDLAATVAESRSNENSKKAEKHSFKRFKILTIVFGVLTFLMVLLSALLGFIADPSFNGDLVEKTVNIDFYDFLFTVVIATLIFFVFIAFLVKTLKTKNANKK